MKKPSKKTNVICMAVFAVLTIVLQSALSRAFVYGLFTENFVHAVFFLVFFICYTFFARKALQERVTKKAMLILSTTYISVFVVMMILLMGFQEFILALAVGIVYISVPFWFLFDKKEIKKSAVCFFFSLVILFLSTIPGYFYRLMEISVREKTQELYISEENGYFARAVAPQKLYIYTGELNTNAEVLLHSSLIAYTSANYSDQIFNGKTYHLETIAKYYPYVEQQYVNTQEEIFQIYGTRIRNYILYDENDRDSIFVAANLCNQKEAVMVGKSVLYIAEKYGWKQVFDTTGWTEEKLLTSEYFEKIDNHIMIMIEPFSQKPETNGKETYISSMWDLAILNNAWIVHNDFTLVELENHLKKLKRNSICIGSIGEKAENGVVQACARYATTFIYTPYLDNMTALTGFDLQDATGFSEVLSDGEIHKKKTEAYSDDATPKHTVCVMLSDADNMLFCTETLVSENYYGSPLRDDTLQYNVGLAGSMVEMAPIYLLEYYDGMKETNDFCYQLSSIGYTYPSKWTDKEAWEQVTKSLARIMKESKTSVLEIMDDSAFFGVFDIPSHFGSLEKYFDTYTCLEEVDGCLFIDYTALYAGYKGAICWSNDKPVVSAKFSAWYDEGTPFHSERNTIEGIIKEVNEMSTDKTSEDAYTFIIVHGWSGIDQDGNFVHTSFYEEGIDNTAIFKALKDGFDEDVEMVTTTEFINRMRRNVKR